MISTSSKSSDSDREFVQESKEGSECTSSNPTMRARFTCSFSDSELDELDDSELVKKPTFWYKPQCGSARHKPLARFYTVYSPTAGQKSFLEKKEQS
ncbi:hypothetical protein Taro_008961 [Colocasia esculenta]|uniref:Uncharacterized protein n=1 Tax=Colocasia esculenta TaxID=4460 RepID=A0A843U3R1_COLES|nr:hypothetical protein [Colocasia esculenta]